MPSSLTELWNELRRRRVVRTLAAYGAVAFLVLQIADLVLPAFTDAEWPYRAVVLLALLGLPVAAVLSWMFDRTDRGLERTPATVKGAPISISVIALIVLVAVSASWFVVKLVRSNRVDSDVVAIFPFRSAGATDDLAFLREGMVDLLATRLSDNESHRTVDAQVLLRSVERLGEQGDNNSRLRIARSLGAGKAVFGEVVGTARNLTISARLVDAVSGRPLASDSESGSADNYVDVVDRLAASLLSLEAGEDIERLAVLTSRSPIALRAYLNGQSLYRRARFRDATREYHSALEIDSTFSLAAVGMLSTVVWAGAALPGFDQRRTEAIAWSGREHFGAVDRAILNALVGPRYPRPSDEREKCDSWNRVAELAPDRAQAWHYVGDCFYHLGTVFNIDDHYRRAEEAFVRSLRPDSLFAPSLIHLATLAAARRDVAKTEQYARLHAQADTLGDQMNALRWYVAYARRDTTTMNRMLLAADTMRGFLQIVEFHQEFTDDFRPIRAAWEVIRQGTTGAVFTRYRWAGHFGDEAAARAVARDHPGDRTALIEMIEGALYADGELAAGEEAIARAKTMLTGENENDRVRAACLNAEWELWNAKSANASRMYAVVDSATHNADPALAEYATICKITIDAIRAVQQKQPDARRHAERVDSLATVFARHATHQSRYMPFIAARLLEMTGDREAALRAVRRRPFQFVLMPGRSYALAEEGRLAAAVGDKDAAITAYRKYLEYRSEAQGRAAETTARVRADLARLTAEPRR